MDDATFDELVKRSEGKCGICRAVFTGVKNRHIDHDHSTGKVRGLLCQKCNFGLGLFNDSLELLRAAAAYLEKSLTPPVPML